MIRAALEALGCEGGRHPDVDDHKVGFQVAHLIDQLRRFARLAHDLEASAREEAGNPLAEEHVVVGHHHARRCRHSEILARQDFQIPGQIGFAFGISRRPPRLVVASAPIAFVARRFQVSS